MKAQTPAEGIMKTNDWGDSKVYKVVCDCGQPDHEHTVWIEADEANVSVQIYVDVKSPFWSMNRFKQIWILLTKGYLKHETVISMSKQQAINYAETLKKAVTDVEEFRKQKS
jgi:flagellar hook-basal body complex protein FliE